MDFYELSCCESKVHLNKGDMSSLLGLNGVKAWTVRSNSQSLELLGKLVDGEVLLGDGVQMTQVPVDSVVLHDGDSGCGTQDEFSTGSGL